MSAEMPPEVAAATVKKLEAETALFEAQAEEVKQKARALKVEADSEERDEQILLAANRYNKVYVFNGEVGAGSVANCMNQLDVWRRNDPGCDIEIVFTSPGGSVVDGLALWDYLQEVKRAGHHLTTVAYGMAASMAGILLQAGDTRILGKESWLMIHEASFGAHGKIGEVEDTVDWVKRVQDRILDIFAERSTKSRALIKKNWLRKDWWLSSDEALCWGFIDEVR